MPTNNIDTKKTTVNTSYKVSIDRLTDIEGLENERGAIAIQNGALKFNDGTQFRTIGEAVTGLLNPIIDASTSSDQEPTALDSPIDIHFGGAQGTAQDPAHIDANGVVNINESGAYIIEVRLNVGRLSNSGTAYIFTRAAIDPGTGSFSIGTTPIYTRLGANGFSIPERIEVRNIFTAGTRAKIQLVRDTNGGGAANDGGLYSNTASGAGWGTSNTARILIYKIG